MNLFLLFKKLLTCPSMFLNKLLNQFLLKHRYSYLEDLELLFLLKKPKSRIVNLWNRGIKEKDYDDLLNLAIRYENEDCALYALENGANAFWLPQTFDERGCYLRARAFEFFLINGWEKCILYVIDRISAKQLDEYEEQWLSESEKMLPIMFKRYTGMPYLNILLKERHSKLFKIVLKKYEEIGRLNENKSLLLLGHALFSANKTELFRIQKLIGWNFGFQTMIDWVQSRVLYYLPKESQCFIFERIKYCQHIKHLKDKKILQKEIKNAFYVKRKVNSL